jgi:hypothetical protein
VVATLSSRINWSAKSVSTAELNALKSKKHGDLARRVFPQGQLFSPAMSRFNSALRINTLIGISFKNRQSHACNIVIGSTTPLRLQSATGSTAHAWRRSLKPALANLAEA